MNRERVPASERREQILAAASRVFGERGYIGATTDQVARAAGISQPYVVRLFGSKENLFLAVLDRVLAKLDAAFRGALAEARRLGEGHEETVTRLGTAYADLIRDRGILLSLMQGFVCGYDPVIGARAREGLLDVYRFLRDDAGLDPDEIVGFLGHGMLFNTLIAVRLVDQHDSDDDCIVDLLEHTFRNKLDLVVNTVTGAASGTQVDARQ